MPRLPARPQDEILNIGRRQLNLLLINEEDVPIIYALLIVYSHDLRPHFRLSLVHINILHFDIVVLQNRGLLLIICDPWLLSRVAHGSVPLQLQLTLPCRLFRARNTFSTAAIVGYESIIKAILVDLALVRGHMVKRVINLDWLRLPDLIVLTRRRVRIEMICYKQLIGEGLSRALLASSRTATLVLFE